MMRRLLLLSLTALLSTCAADKTAATRDNFELTLATYFEMERPRACPLQGLRNAGLNFPFEAYSKNLRDEDVGALIQLQRLGFVTITQQDTILGPLFGFALTEQGAQHPGFCVGNYTFARLKNFSQPEGSTQGRLVHADLGVKVVLDEWAQDPEVQQGFTYARQRAGEMPARATLRLAEHGWEVTGVQLP